MINIQKGTKDMLPKDSYKWNKVRQVANVLARKYNLTEIATPVFESTELFVRSDGDSSDIVNKEMYSTITPRKCTPISAWWKPSGCSFRPNGRKI